jgi:hypothetical protein
MPYTEIDWPVNPFVGQVYTSSFERKWLWNGCAWTASCCPPCNAGDGLDLVASFSDNAGVYFNLSFLYTGTDGNGYPQYGLTLYPGYDYTINYNLSLTRWEVYFDTQFLAWSYEIYGSYGVYWNQGDPSTLNYLTTTCGATFPILCLDLDGTLTNLLSTGSLPGETSAFQAEGGLITWDGSQWTGSVGFGGSTLITLPGVSSVPPAGTWTIVDPGSPSLISSVVTSLGSCSFGG